MRNRLLRSVLVLAITALATACAHYQPRQVESACDILRGSKKWYRATVATEKRWGTPVGTQLAFVYQESGFVADARPPRRRILWVIPGPRPSDAYGYAQAKKATWRWYQDKTGEHGADRDKFADAVDFIGWYNRESLRRLKIPLTDPYRQYLAYHDGHGGYERRTYAKNASLQAIAQKVAARAKRYDAQLQKCQQQLDDAFSSWFF
jgi:hypothetical protein